MHVGGSPSPALALPRGEKLRNLRVAAERMLASPCTYSRSPDHAGCRCIICEGYFFLYEVSPDTESNATAGDITLLAVYPPGFGSRIRP